MDVKEEIYKTVETIVERYVANQNQTEQVSGIVLNSINGKYTVQVNGSKYVVKDGVGINPPPNTKVWVCIPNKDWNKAYICAGKGTPSGGSGNVDDVYQNGNSVLGDDHIARINCATPEDIQQLQVNFQAGVDSIYDACVTKGSTPESHALSDVVDGILAIPGGGGEFAYIEAQQKNARPISDNTSRIISTTYITLEEATRVRFYSTLNFNVALTTAGTSATVTITYWWDSESSAPITQTYGAGNQVLTVDFLTPELTAGDHIFSMRIAVAGGSLS